jgi:DNA-binding LacI/PurR family transcriptional regulator
MSPNSAVVKSSAEVDTVAHAGVSTSRASEPRTERWVYFCPGAYSRGLRTNCYAAASYDPSFIAGGAELSGQRVRGQGWGAARHATIRDVARLSEVSTATVTRVLQGQPSVRGETRARVEEAVRILGYRPDGIARALVTRMSNSVGMLLPSSGDSFWGEVAAGIEERALEQGFSVLLGTAHGEAERESAMMELFLSKRVEGIIAGGSVGDPTSWLPQSLSAPIVLVNWHGSFDEGDLRDACEARPYEVLQRVTRTMAVGPHSCHIVFDDIGGARLLVQDLIREGHRAFAFVGGGPIRPTLLRIIGFRLALEDAALEPLAIVPNAETLEAGRAAALDLLSRPHPPTAIIAYSDLVAIGVLRGTHALGIPVPAVVSVAGFDDIDLAAFVEPPLTTVGQPKRDMGQLAVEMILQALGGERLSGTTEVSGKVIVRSSTGPPPA